MKIKLFVLSVWVCALVSCQKPTDAPAPGDTPKSSTSPTATTETKIEGQAANAIKVSIPAGHQIFSVVVDDMTGTRVRNLISMGKVTSHGGSATSTTAQVINVVWDGKDDDGKEVIKGTYKVRGVTAPELDALYEYSFYNPGNTPWHGTPNSGWGSNHGDPVAIACLPAGVDSPWRTVVSCNGSEGTDFMFVIGKTDQKIHGWYTAWGSSMAVDVVSNEVYSAQGNSLKRFSAGDAKLVGWKKPAGVVNELKMATEVTSLSVSTSNAAVVIKADAGKGLKSANLILMDRFSGKTNAGFELASPIKVAYAPNEKLYGVVSNAMSFGEINIQTGVHTPIALPGLEKAGAFNFDPSGQLYIFDEGSDKQVKIYNPDLKTVARTVGVKGGAKKVAAYDANGFYGLLALDIDDRGFLWTSEGAHPRRQAVWDKDGKLVKEFVGSTYYGAWNSQLHDQDPTLAGEWNVILKVDPAQTQSYKVLKFITSGKKEGSAFSVENGVPWAYFHRNQLFRSKASGTEHEYLVSTSTFPTVYLKKGDDYRPVAAMWTKSIHASISPYSVTGDPDGTIYMWSDLNEDELHTPNEIVTFPGTTGSNGKDIFPFPHNFHLYNGGYEIKPTRWSAAGAPIYESQGLRKIDFKTEKVADRVKNDPANRQKANQFMVRVGNHLQSGFGDWPYFFTGVSYWTDLDGKVVATRKVKGGGVHGSMAVPAPLPDGEMLGELFVAGTAETEAGFVMAIHGNYGQVYFLTEDGIFISSIFKDARSNPDPWGDKVVRGKSWKNISMYQEAFCGWFGKQDDGKMRYMFGHTSANVVEITGLDKMKRFDAGKVAWNPAPK